MVVFFIENFLKNHFIGNKTVWDKMLCTFKYKSVLKINFFGLPFFPATYVTAIWSGNLGMEKKGKNTAKFCQKSYFWVKKRVIEKNRVLSNIKVFRLQRLKKNFFSGQMQDGNLILKIVHKNGTFQFSKRVISPEKRVGH